MKNIIVFCILILVLGCSKNPISSVPATIKSKAYIKDTLVADVMSNHAIVNYTADTNIPIALNILLFHQEQLFPEFIPLDTCKTKESDLYRSQFVSIDSNDTMKRYIIFSPFNVSYNLHIKDTSVISAGISYNWVYNGQDTVRILMSYSRMVSDSFDTEGIQWHTKVDSVTFAYDSLYAMIECTWKKFGIWDYDFLIKAVKE